MRRKSRKIHVGKVAVGGDAPVSVQTMAKAPPQEVETIVAQLVAARQAGCDIARIAVCDRAAAATIAEIKDRTGLAVVADVHFDHRLAVEAARLGADALRINPGNLGGEDALRAVVEAAGQAGIPIRVGVNAGSLPKTEGQLTRPTVHALVDSALEMVRSIQTLGLQDIKVSLKAFDVATTVEANRRFAQQSDLPLHLGVTEAGPLLAGTVRSVAALAPLLAEGIGDTIRISLTASPADEARAGVHLLRALGMRRGPMVVSCPTCGRTRADLRPVAERIEALLESRRLELVVAVMGCEVNGPGEAREADLGIAYGPRGTGLLFASGRVVGSYPNERLEEVLVEQLMRQCAKGTAHA